MDGVPILEYINWSLTPKLVSSLNLMSMHSVISSRSLVKTLNRTQPSTDLWSTSFVTSLQVEHDPLTMRLWVQLSSQFIILLVVHYLDCTFETRILWESVESPTKINMNYIHFSPLFPKSHDFITEVNQVGQASFTFCQCMLTVPNDLLLLYMPRNVFQKDLLRSDKHQAPIRTP